MSHHRASSLLPIVIGCLACSTSTPAVRRVDLTQALPPEIPKVGVVPNLVGYALPRTVLRVSYTAVRADFGKPECAADDTLRQLLGIEDMKLPTLEGGDKASVFSVKDGVLTTVSEPDPSEVFYTTMTNDSLVDDSLKVVLGPDGIVSAVEGSARDVVGPTVVKAIEVAGAITAAALPFTLFKESAPKGEIKLHGKKLTTSGLDARCTEKVDRYLKLEEQRQEVLAMKVPHAKDAYELRLGELRAAQDVIRASFLGLKRTITAPFTCDVVPATGSASLPSFSLAVRRGIKPEGDARCRIPVEFRHAAGATPPANEDVSEKVAIAVTPHNEALTQLWTKLDADNRPTEAGFFYRVPGAGTVAVDSTRKGVAIAPHRVTIAQLGSVRAYPRVSGSNPKLTFELYPDTGALKSVLVEQKATDVAGLLGALGGASTAVLTAEKARRDAAAAAEEAKRKDAANAELTNLQKQQAILEATLAIKEAREALGL
jgi:hypothetical protein